MTSLHDPYKLGYFSCATIFFTIFKIHFIKKFLKKKILRIIFLKFENMKLKLLVIENKNVSVNLFLNFVHTARHAMEITFT